MGKIDEVRTALAAAMSTIDGLQVEKYIRVVTNPPQAVIAGPVKIDYDKAFGRGHDDYTFQVVVFSSPVSDEEAQADLDRFIDPYGPLSIKAAIESSDTLGGVVESVFVSSADEYDLRESEGVEYLSAVLTVTMMVPGKA